MAVGRYPFDIIEYTTLWSVCQEVSQTFHTNYYPDLTDNLLFVDSIYLSAENRVKDSWFNQTHFRVQRLALQRGVLCFLPILSQGRAPSDFLGYSLSTFSIVAHSLRFVKREFQISLKFFRLNPDGSDPSLSRFPLDIIYYSRLPTDCN
nr:MAG TPA: hypothetical protein [Caudoviricetes sp.]